VIDETKEDDSEYIVSRLVLGLKDIHGRRPLYPVTVYNLTNDDTSGVAGLLLPDGTFLRAPEPRAIQKFWDHTETHEYILNENMEGGRSVIGWSWQVADVVWDGSIVGSIDPDTLDSVDGDEEGRNPCMRRMWDQALTGDWLSTGELWRAMERGNAQTGRTIGRIHSTDPGARQGDGAGNLGN
jgi:hypothetical protein